MLRAQRSLFAVWALACLCGSTMADICSSSTVKSKDMSTVQLDDWWVAARSPAATKVDSECVKVRVTTKENTKEFDVSTFKWGNYADMKPAANYTVTLAGTDFTSGYKVTAPGVATATYKLLDSTSDYALFCGYDHKADSNFGFILIRKPTYNFDHVKTAAKTSANLADFQSLTTGCISTPSGASRSFAPVVFLWTTAAYALLKFYKLL